MNYKEAQNYVGLVITGVLALATIQQIAFGAFHKLSREKIRSRDGVCQVCKKHGDHCSHFNHDHQYKQYQDPNNGELLCLPHHLLFHARHLDGVDHGDPNQAKKGLSPRAIEWLANHQKHLQNEDPTRQISLPEIIGMNQKSNEYAVQKLLQTIQELYPNPLDVLNYLFNRNEINSAEKAYLNSALDAPRPRDNRYFRTLEEPAMAYASGK